jgi:hypothetical protein
VDLLRRIQTVCVKQSPLDYHDYEGDFTPNLVIYRMLAGEIPTLPLCEPSRFKVSKIRPLRLYEIYTLVLFFLIIHMFANKANIYHEQEAALLVEELVDKEGDAEFEKAKERCFVEESDKMVVDMFESPFEDYVLFSERKKFANAPMAYMDG